MLAKYIYIYNRYIFVAMKFKSKIEIVFQEANLYFYLEPICSNPRCFRITVDSGLRAMSA
jgi:hypothetical protein